MAHDAHAYPLLRGLVQPGGVDQLGDLIVDGHCHIPVDRQLDKIPMFSGGDDPKQNIRNAWEACKRKNLDAIESNFQFLKKDENSRREILHSPHLPDHIKRHVDVKATVRLFSHALAIIKRIKGGRGQSDCKHDMINLLMILARI